LLAATCVLLTVVAVAAQPAAKHPFFATELATQVIAHRGGAGLRPENTLTAFTHAAELGADILEMDVQNAADGAIVAMHDATVDRTTDGTGRVDSMTLAKLRELDAGYRWSRDGGKSNPYRGTGVKIPLLDEVFARFPAMRMNIEMKNASEKLAHSLCALTRQRGMSRKVLVASMNSDAIAVFRRECPEVATSMTAGEARLFYALSFIGLSGAYNPDSPALQMPYRIGERIIATPDLIQAAHRSNLKTHVWTINDETRMRELIAAGVDGIITDRPDVLLKVLGRNKSN
jgi:glycerophosphoryl diester phosphodiesterase